MFGTNKTIAAQDPSYPVYVDTTVMMGNTGTHNGTGFEGIEYMVCTPENKFFPDLSKVWVAVYQQTNLHVEAPTCHLYCASMLSRV
jgi:hypothetical protein